MKARSLLLDFLGEYKDYAPVFLRALIGVFIIYGVQDNVFSQEHMREFADFLRERSVPFPLFSASVSAYVQMICGVSILLGAFIRLASVLFIINFVAAIVIAHLGDGFRAMFPALMMIAAGFFFLLNGAGKLSVDDLLAPKDHRQ